MSAAPHIGPRRPFRELLPRLARVARLARKELAEILCDRRTILTLLLMPLLLYTVLSFAFRQFLMAFFASTDPTRPLIVAVETEAQRRLVEDYLAFGAEVPWWHAAGIVGLDVPSPAPGPLLAASLSLSGRFYHEPHVALPGYGVDPLGRRMHPPLIVLVMKNPGKALSSGQVDAVVQIPGRRVHPAFGASIVGLIGSPQGDGPLLAASGIYPGRIPVKPPDHPLKLLIDGDYSLKLEWDLQFLEFSPRSRATVNFLEQHCAVANARQLQNTLDRLGVRQPAVPVRINRLGVESGDAAPGLSLTALVPLILILMTITGAVYPAIDLTAGERERGTLEILVAAPVPRLMLLFAKYVAVVAVAMLTATVNLTMMLVTLQMNNLTKEVFKQTGVTVQLVVELFFLLVLFAAFFSAVLLALTSFARSFKEAQAYLVPLMLVSLVPGVLGMMPGLRLQGILTVTPLVNIVLLARDLAERTATPARAAVVVLSTLVYAAAAITVAVRIFGAEAVLFSEQSGWSDLFRRPAKSRRAASLSGGLLCLALLLPLSFALISLTPQAPQWRLLYQVLGTFVLFGGVPLAACFMARINVQSCFQLTLPPSWTAWLAALLLAVAAVPAIYQLLFLLQQWDLLSLTAQMQQHLRTLTRGWRESASAPTVAATLALIGVGEELFFRGFLFSALRSHVSKRWTIVGSAFLFGLFHFVSQIDRLIPSTVMGLLLGWVCWQTRSVLPGMLLHGSYNALFILVTYYERELDDPDALQNILIWWQFAAVLAAIIGASLIWRLRSPERPVAAIAPPDDKVLSRNVPAERTA